MKGLRVGIDLDGTLADLSAGYHDVERRLFGVESQPEAVDETGADPAEVVEERDKKADLKAARAAAAHRDIVWQALRSTRDFWTTLKPVEVGVIRKLHDVSRARGWEVYFLTQRPATVGETVQRQSQLWLREHGFELPTVLTLAGARGRVAAALELDALIDDLPKNCVDVISDSKCRPLLVLRRTDATAEAAAKGLRIGVVRSVDEGIDILASDAADTETETVMQRVWRHLGLA
jgi:hypothetical protein